MAIAKKLQSIYISDSESSDSEVEIVDVKLVGTHSTSAGPSGIHRPSGGYASGSSARDRVFTNEDLISACRHLEEKATEVLVGKDLKAAIQSLKETLDATAIKSHSGLVGCEYLYHLTKLSTPSGTSTWFTECLAPRKPSLWRTQPPTPSSALQFRDEALFKPINGFKLAAEPIGHLPKEMIEALEHEYMMTIRDLHALLPSSPSLATSYSSSPATSLPSASNDSKVKMYRSRIQYLLGHLKHEASTFSETLMAWRICQRVCLELRARITWIQSVEPQWGVHQACKVPSMRAVIGALTDWPDIAECCLRASWYSDLVISSNAGKS
ncbi:hypothetical protein FB446DRAFT_795176 [Lentinula raphanica]|nr:hypothetical protein FB446DRAFT_795176 [Lentinula raphanica]